MARTRTGALIGLLLVAASGCPTPRPEAHTSRAPTLDASAEASTADAAPPEASTAAAVAPTLLPMSWLDRRRQPPTDVCQPARENLDRAAKAILQGDGRRDPTTARPWDGKTPPKLMPLVDGRFALTSAEKALLAKNGFVVPARLATRGYADAFHELYQSQVPIYVSADAILHAVFKSNDAILTSTEFDLLPRLSGLLEKMHGQLAKQRDYPPEVARDVDVYLTVARALLAGDARVKSALGTDAESAPLIEAARKASGGLSQVTLFGRPRVIDFSQFAPRGHYAKKEELGPYFRASMWLSRLELNLVSRASRSSQPGLTPNPEETPREAVDALALADLAERAGVLGELDAIEGAWTQFAGKREDVPIRALLALRKQAGITTLSVPDSAEKLKAQIGAGYQRTMRMHYMPQGSTPLPAIATMLGPRVVADAQAETELVHSQVAGRSKPSFADVAFMLGHDRAKTWLAPELAQYPALLGKLEAGRSLLAAVPPSDLYSAWLAALRGLAVTPAGAPSFMKTEAFRDLRVNAAVAGYGQLRHNYVLLAGQAYDEGGCEVPDGYIDPAVDVYEAIRTYARRGIDAMNAVSGSQENKAYFVRLESTMSVLLAIARDELAGRALSEEEKRWLSMVVEIVPPSSDGPGSYDGWYFDLFPTIADAFDEHAFVADWFTSSNANAIVYAGATEPRLGFFVVDTGGEPRIMVGPVARAFEHVAPLSRRLTDTDAAKLKNLREPWAASYTVAAPADPPLTVLSLLGGRSAFAAKSTYALGPVTFELLGHHRELIGKKTASIGAGWTTVVVPSIGAEAQYPEIVRVRIGEVTREISSGWGEIDVTLGGMPAVGWEAAQKVREKLEKPLQDASP